MMEYVIHTWNTQGDFTHVPKMQVINRITNNRRQVIWCIQEGGVRKTGRQGRWDSHGGPQIGSYNERCTNYVLMNASYAAFAAPVPHVITDGDLRLVVGGGEAGRAPAAIALPGLLIISWHSLAGQSNEDTATLIRAIESNPDYTREFGTVVIAGDFNSTPDDIRDLITHGSVRQRRTWTYQHRYLYHSGAATHSGRAGDRELDFFVVLSKTQLSDSGSMANFRGVGRTLVGPSDHNPVVLTIFV